MSATNPNDWSYSHKLNQQFGAPCTDAGTLVSGALGPGQVLHFDQGAVGIEGGFLNGHSRYRCVGGILEVPIIYTGWWFGTFFIFPYIGNNHPN